MKQILQSLSSFSEGRAMWLYREKSSAEIGK